MNFLTCYSENIILFDGPMETRLKYQDHVALPADFAIFEYIYDASVADKLAALYRDDIAITQRYQLPIMLSMPTYRASEKYLAERGYNPLDVAKINQDCFTFVDNVRRSYTNKKADIFINGPVGPKNNAYNGELALSAQESETYHQAQINALATAGVDLIHFVTMPGLQEALGCAKAAAKTNVPYAVGFVIDKEAKLLDGTALRDAINDIDSQVEVKPLCYLISCTHPSIIATAFEHYYPEYTRIKGIKANGSCKSPAELERLQCALADPAAQFAAAVVGLAREYNWKIIGGCCGTDDTHLEAMAQLLATEK